MALCTPPLTAGFRNVHTGQTWPPTFWKEIFLLLQNSTE